MATHKMFFSGLGGQGIMLMGQIIGSAAIHDNKESTFFPSYGPEMRGGTANCTVIVSDKTISNPVISVSDCVVAMNLPSLIKFEPTLKPGGMLFINTSMIHQAPKRSDITIFEIPVSDIAKELGNPRVANIIMLGAFIRKTGVVSEESVKKVIHEVFSEAKADLLELELKAFNYWQE